MSTIDLDAYFRRIGYSGSRAPTAETLSELHFAHALHIPFENLDLQLGRPIRLDPESLQAKLVYARRGGYCFEHNTLFAAVLEQLGFTVTKLGARVRWSGARLLPRTHMLLKVDASGQSRLADVGFGGAGLLRPVPLEVGRETAQGAWNLRLREEPGTYVLQTQHGGAWRDMYAFTLEPHYYVDFEMANYYISTHPESPFVRSLIVQRPTPEVRYGLRNREFVEERGSAIHTQTIERDEEILEILGETFGLPFPAGTRFRALQRP